MRIADGQAHFRLRARQRPARFSAGHTFAKRRQVISNWLAAPGGIPISQTFWDTMSGFGWIEGKNVTVESRYAKTADELPILAQELARLEVDLILTDGTPATRAAKSATETIPIVFSIGADPVRQGFVASLAKPGGNLSGFTFGSYEDKQLEVLKQALPGISRVAYPIREMDPAIARAAANLGVEVQAIRVGGPEDLQTFFQAVRSRKVDAVVFPPTSHGRDPTKN